MSRRIEPAGADREQRGGAAGLSATLRLCSPLIGYLHASIQWRHAIAQTTGLLHQRWSIRSGRNRRTTLTASIRDTSEHIADAGLRGSSAKYFPAGTVLIAMYGANVGQLRTASVCLPPSISDLRAMRQPAIVADARFVFYALLRHSQRVSIGQAAGAAQQNLNQAIDSQIPLPLPPVSTQRKIAAILSAYDDLIENNRRRIKLLEEMAQRDLPRVVRRLPLSGPRGCATRRVRAGA